MIPSLLNEVCLKILAEYLLDPWAWPRESDLIVDLVSRIRSGLPAADRRVPARLDGLQGSSKLLDVGGTVARSLPRVRTELKLAEDGIRVDVGIYRNQEIRCSFNHEGARDVNLRAFEDDVEALLEVKLCPDKYEFSGEHPCRWLADLLKLDDLARATTRGVLLLDTSLPLKTIGVAYKRGRNGATTLARDMGTEVAHADLPPWPIPDGGFRVVNQHGAFTFERVDAPPAEGLYLWGLALKGSWKPEFSGNLVPLLSEADVVPRCWSVTVSKD